MSSEEPCVARAIVIGGCHVTSFGIGASPPFWSGFVTRRGAAQVEVIGHASMKRALEVVQSAAPLAPGTLVVLQLGHHDVWKELALLNPLTARYVRRKGGQRASLSSTETIASRHVGTAALLKTFVRGTLMWALDRLLVSPTKQRRGRARLDHLFTAIITQLREAGAEEIVVMSTFPTISPRLNQQRALVRDIMRHHAAAGTFVFVDVWHQLARGRGAFLLPRRDTLLDTVHLSVAGHDVVAGVLTRVALPRPMDGGDQAMPAATLSDQSFARSVDARPSRA
ncbi:GDSL-type esterase/lipase family protein [Sphingomonas sp. DT-51]|uniref:GDSL-type esterase/lipase family protein n=1 Tax=Sphingomonas sp. DT-51 TaxID=3396165 RepID=UPI003F19E137